MMTARSISLFVVLAISAIVLSSKPAMADNFNFTFTNSWNGGISGTVTGEIIGLPANCTACNPTAVIIESAPNVEPDVYLNAATPGFPMNVFDWSCEAGPPTSCSTPLFLTFNVSNGSITQAGDDGVYWSTVPPEENRTDTPYETFGFSYSFIGGCGYCNVANIEWDDLDPSVYGSSSIHTEGIVTFTPAPVPEPSTISLTLLGIAWLMRKRIGRSFR